MQESYLKVFQKIDALENEDGFSAWMNIIVNNAAKDFLKKKETVHNDVKFSELDSDDFNESFESTLENDYSDFEPQALVDYTILKEGMEECLNKLSFHEKSTLYKFYFENMKIGEIAEEMEANQNTIKTWISRGKKSLETILVSLQKKDAAFFGVGAIPFFVWMLNEELDSICTLKATEVAKIIVAATKSTEIATKSSTLKAFFATAKGKAIAIGVMVAVLGGGVGIYGVFGQQPQVESKVEHKTTKKKQRKKKSQKLRNQKKSQHILIIGLLNIKRYIMMLLNKHKP